MLSSLASLLVDRIYTPGGITSFIPTHVTFKTTVWNGENLPPGRGK